MSLPLALYDLTLDHISLVCSTIYKGNSGLSFSRHCPLTPYDLTLDHIPLTYSWVNIKNADLSVSRLRPLNAI